MHDGDISQSDCPTAERLAAVRAWRSAWRSKHWTLTRTYETNNIDSDSLCFSADVLYPTTRDGRGVVFMRLPSESRRTEEKTWTVTEFASGVENSRKYYNGVQDLLVESDKCVVSECSLCSFNANVIHLGRQLTLYACTYSRQMGTGTPTPRAVSCRPPHE